jgi:fucose 4-O-acetylase-like acetyltransferase
MDFINNLLANLLDSLKVKNPTLWAILAVLITGIFTAVTTGVNIGFIKVEPGTTLATVVQLLTFISGLFLQSRTTSFIKPIEKEETKEV